MRSYFDLLRCIASRAFPDLRLSPGEASGGEGEHSVAVLQTHLFQKQGAARHADFYSGYGSFLPPRVLHNRDLEKILDTNDEWITQRTGIRERRVAEPEMAASDLALEASRSALEMAGMNVADLQLIIVATITPDTHCPAAVQLAAGQTGGPPGGDL